MHEGFVIPVKFDIEYLNRLLKPTSTLKYFKGTSTFEINRFIVLTQPALSWENFKSAILKIVIVWAVKSRKKFMENGKRVFITYKDTHWTCISFVLSSWIINEFFKLLQAAYTLLILQSFINDVCNFNCVQINSFSSFSGLIFP